jgi:hypothetical protein
MERKVYVRSWKINPDSCVYCVPKTYKEELKTLFKNFVYELSILNFDDDKSVYIRKEDYDVSDREFWYLVLTVLKNNGYEFSSYVTTRYAWYENEHLKAEEEKRLKAQKAELERQEKERQEKERLEKIKQEESEYGLLCNKYGCLTNIGFCINKCKYNTQYNMNCRPERVKIKKEGI